MLSTLFVLLSKHLNLLVWSLIATLMVIYGATLNQWIRKLLGGLPMLARFLIFVMICAVGYGWFSLFIVDLVVTALSRLSPTVAFACLCSGFLAVGWLAQRHRLI